MPRISYENMINMTLSCTSCNGWMHMLLDVTGQMWYCCRRSRCFLISDTSWRPRTLLLFLFLSCSSFYVSPTGSEKYPLLQSTSTKHIIICFLGTRRLLTRRSKPRNHMKNDLTRFLTPLSGSSLYDPFVLEVPYVKFGAR